MFGGYFFGQSYFGDDSVNLFSAAIKDIDKYVPDPYDPEIVQFVQV